MMNSESTLNFLRGQMDKVLEDIEALKDKNREMYLKVECFKEVIKYIPVWKRKLNKYDLC